MSGAVSEPVQRVIAPDVSVIAEPSLRSRALRGSAWIVAGTLARQGLKFVSSLILTRLLFPEAFGLAATAGLLIIAVEMCSDFGIRPALVQHPAGGTSRYLDTAWTLMFVRGFGLAGALAMLAWPFAAFFGQPEIFWLALMIAVTPILRGAASPALFLWLRNLDQWRLNLLETSTDAIRIVATILGALLWRNVWGLAAGGLVGEVVRTALSYTLGPRRPCWYWDRTAARELVRFGRFIFISSVLGFFALRLDAFFVAKFLGMQRAGVYCIAAAIAAPIEVVGIQVMGSVLFPALSRRQKDPSLLSQHVSDVLRVVSLVILPAGFLLAAAAPFLVGLLYDVRYEQAGVAARWLLVAACLGFLAHGLNAPLLATGRPYWGTGATGVRLLTFCSLAPVLGTRFGIEGYAQAVALSAAAFTIALMIGASLHGHVRPLNVWGDAFRFLIFACALGVTSHLDLLGTSGSVRGVSGLLLGIALLALLWITSWKRVRAVLRRDGEW